MYQGIDHAAPEIVNKTGFDLAILLLDDGCCAGQPDLPVFVFEIVYVFGPFQKALAPLLLQLLVGRLLVLLVGLVVSEGGFRGPVVMLDLGASLVGGRGDALGRYLRLEPKWRLC